MYYTYPQSAVTTSFKVLLSVQLGVLVAVIVKLDIPLVQISCNFSTIFSEITQKAGSGAKLNLTTKLHY